MQTFPRRPRGVAAVACMHVRPDIRKLHGPDEGDAHVIRNAGDVVSDDATRSLAISQRLLGAGEIIVIHHTGCGMSTFRHDDVKDAMEADAGLRPNRRSCLHPRRRGGQALPAIPESPETPSGTST